MKSWKFNVYLVFFGISLFLFLLLFLSDIRNCLGENTLLSCFSHYMNYNFHAIVGKCYLNKIDEKGVSNETHKLLVDVYLLDKSKDKNWVEKLFNETNSIWNEYGISIYINNINILNNTQELIISKPENVDFLNKYLGKKMCDNTIDLVIAKGLSTKFKILIWDFTSKQTEGQGLRNIPGTNITDLNLIWISSETKNVSWGLAHELGHVIGNLDKAAYTGEFNLMTHGGCVRDDFYPTILNQKQVDIAISTAKSLKHKT